jgi:hypothetical protein
MKTKKYFFALAILGVLMFASCTPNSIGDDGPQEIRKDQIKVPTNG